MQRVHTRMIEDWSAVAGLARNVRRLEEHAQALYSLERQAGMGKTLLEQLVTDVGYEWLMMGASHIKVHPHAAATKGANQDMQRTKGGSTQSCTGSWMGMVCRSEYLSQQIPLQITRKLASSSMAHNG